MVVQYWMEFFWGWMCYYLLVFYCWWVLVGWVGMIWWGRTVLWRSRWIIFGAIVVGVKLFFEMKGLWTSENHTDAFVINIDIDARPNQRRTWRGRERVPFRLWAPTDWDWMRAFLQLGDVVSARWVLKKSGPSDHQICCILCWMTCWEGGGIVGLASGVEGMIWGSAAEGGLKNGGIAMVDARSMELDFLDRWPSFLNTWLGSWQKLCIEIHRKK